jgi:hypothetical protein
MPHPVTACDDQVDGSAANAIEIDYLQLRPHSPGGGSSSGGRPACATQIITYNLAITSTTTITGLNKKQAMHVMHAQRIGIGITDIDNRLPIRQGMGHGPGLSNRTQNTGHWT